jgi:Xaa-Pro aminopeptidase
VIELARMNGEPTGCHPTFCTGRNASLGLSSPNGEIVRRGNPLAANISYYGSNICRAAWIAESAEDLPVAARDYVPRFAGIYFEAMREWFALMRPGVAGGEIWRMIHQRLPFELFGIFLNPGHLIHLDEWVSSPVYRDSDVALHSGMAFQVDVIPSSPTYFSTRMEDGIVIADAALRKQLQEQWPDCYRRCEARRSFMIEVLGIELPEEVLPLSNMPAIVVPFLLRPNTVFALEP